MNELLCSVDNTKCPEDESTYSHPLVHKSKPRQEGTQIATKLKALKKATYLKIMQTAAPSFLLENEHDIKITSRLPISLEP